MESNVTSNFILSTGQHLPYLIFSWHYGGEDLSCSGC